MSKSRVVSGPYFPVLELNTEIFEVQELQVFPNTGNSLFGHFSRSVYLIRFVPDQYKTQQMYDLAIPENVGTLKSVPDWYKNQEMCNKAVDNYPHALDFVPECY